MRRRSSGASGWGSAGGKVDGSCGRNGEREPAAQARSAPESQGMNGATPQGASPSCSREACGRGGASGLAGQPQLGVDVREVALDRARAQEQALGDLLV